MKTPGKGPFGERCDPVGETVRYIIEDSSFQALEIADSNEGRPYQEHERANHDDHDEGMCLGNQTECSRPYALSPAASCPGRSKLAIRSIGCHVLFLTMSYATGEVTRKFTLSHVSSSTEQDKNTTSRARRGQSTSNTIPIPLHHYFIVTSVHGSTRKA